MIKIHLLRNSEANIVIHSKSLNVFIICFIFHLQNSWRPTHDKNLNQAFCLLSPFLALAGSKWCWNGNFSNWSQILPGVEPPVSLESDHVNVWLECFLVNCLVDNDRKYFNEMLDLPIERFIYQYFLLDLTGHMEVQPFCQSLLVTQVTEIINLFKHHPASLTSLQYKYHHKHHCTVPGVTLILRITSPKLSKVFKIEWLRQFYV